MRLLLILLLAIPALAAPPPSLDGFAEKDSKTRFEILDALVRAKKPLAKAEVALVVEHLRNDTDDFVRLKAAELMAFAQGDLKLALAALVEVVGNADDEVFVRQTAVRTLGEIGRGSKRVEAALVQAGKTPLLANAATAALAKIKATDTTQKVPEKPKETGGPARPPQPANPIAAFDGTGEAFVAALAGTDVNLRRAAMRSIAKRGYDRKKWSDEEVEAIRKAATDPDAAIRGMAFTALGLLNETSKMVPMLMEAITSDDQHLASSAALALSKAGPLPAEHLAPVLKVLESTKAQNTRVYLFYTCQHFGDGAKPAVPVLCKFLKDPAVQNRLLAASTLMTVGRLDPEAVAAALKDLPPEPDAGVAGWVKRLREAYAK